jgi:hypothetical protein
VQNSPENDDDLYDLIDVADAKFEKAYQSTLEQKKRAREAARGLKRPLKEHEVQRNIASELEKDGFMVIRINSSTQIAESGTRLSSYRVTNINATAGHADLVVYRDGRVWMLEVKRDKRGKQSESQIRFEDCCKRYGVPYAVVTCAQDARYFITLNT